jgi:hypothetical protein
VLLHRIGTRAANEYGKSTGEQEAILGHLRDVEPLRRASCTHEIHATLPPEEVVARLVEIARDPAS